MIKPHKSAKHKRKKAGILLICSLLLSLVFVFPSFATEADASAESGQAAQEDADKIDKVNLYGDGYSAVLYNNTNALPTSDATSIAQTAEGFIWIGSYSGLIRYDGKDFERLDASYGIANVACLYVDENERLWIGTNDSGVALMEKETITWWTKADGLPSASVRAIVEDENGMLYVATTGGLAMIDNDQTLYYLQDERVDETNIKNLHAGGDGLIYGLSNSGDIFTIRNGKLESYYEHENYFLSDVSCIYPDPNNPGKIYLDSESSGVFYGSLDPEIGDYRYIDTSPLQSILSFTYVDDQLWLCARNGIGYLSNDGILYCLQNLPMDIFITHLMQDYEGNLWFTSSRQGVMKIVENQFIDMNIRYQLEPAVVNSTCKWEHLLFIGTDSGLMILGENGLLESFPIKKAKTAAGFYVDETDLLEWLRDCRIRSIIRDSKDRLWIATWAREGLLCYDNGVVTVYDIGAGLLSEHIRTVLETQDGSILVACTGGVNVIKDGKVTASYNEQDGIVNDETLTVCEAASGDILIGSDGDGIYIIGEGGTRHIGSEEGLSSEVVMRIKKDEKRNIYWIVTGNSLSYMTADYQITTINQFPYTNNFDLYEDSDGNIWVLSSNGIYITTADDLLSGKEIAFAHYGISNGLPCVATANSYSELTEDGDLYISGTTGVVKVNINTQFEKLSHLKMAVPYVDADGERIYPDENGNFTLSPGVKKLTIYAYVYNYSLVDPLISYRLEGLDEKKMIVSRSDLDPIDYTNLQGKEYRFVMRIEDLDEDSSNELAVTINKKKALYEMSWFYSLVGLAIALALIFGVRRYVRKKMEMLNNQLKEEAEKERIGSELNMAAQIQEGVLPTTFPAFPDKNEFDIYASMKPAKEVGGDFYDFFLIDEDHLALVMADVSGKGIPASLFMMVSKAILKSNAKMGQSVADTLRITNETICSNNKMEMFVTVWMGVLEISSGVLMAANAGHEYPALKQGDTFELLKDKHGFVIGGMDGINYSEYSLKLNPGDKLFLYTDGVPEATSRAKELFGTDRMIEALNKNPNGSPWQTLHDVDDAVNAFVKDAEQFDDLTMLCLKYIGKQS